MVIAKTGQDRNAGVNREVDNLKGVPAVKLTRFAKATNDKALSRLINDF